MTNEIQQQQTNRIELKNALNTDEVKAKFAEMLGKKSAGFLSSIATVVSNNALLQKADVNTILLAASQAAALDLPINQNLGYAAIIPFYDGKTKRNVAQFQIMVNGYVELAMRSGQFMKLNCCEVYEGELVSKNRFIDEYVFDETKRVSDKIIGYMAYMKLVNGFEKTIYWTVDEVKAHGIRYSQTFKKGFGVWVENFSAMAKKTLLKHLLVKYAPKSIEMLTAIESDQASFNGEIGNTTPYYPDNEQVPVDFVEAEAEEVTENTQATTETPSK